MTDENHRFIVHGLVKSSFWVLWVSEIAEEIDCCCAVAGVVCIFETEVRRGGKIYRHVELRVEQPLGGGRMHHDSVEMRALLESAENSQELILWQRKPVRRDAVCFCGIGAHHLAKMMSWDDRVAMMDAGCEMDDGARMLMRSERRIRNV